jgi:hypothetical protein
MGYKGTTKYHGKFSAGQKISRWTVVSGDIVLQREAMIQVICECGNTKLVSAYTISKGISTGCKDCQNASYVGKKNPFWKGGEIIGSGLFSRIKRQARKRNIPFSITIKDIEMLYEKQKGKCALTNLPINFSDNSASLDRIDSKHGYIKENIQWVHKDVNLMKNAFTQEYFIQMCSLIHEHKI